MSTTNGSPCSCQPGEGCKATTGMTHHKPVPADDGMLLEQFEHVIESAYQDMRGVMQGKKKYRLRHRELAEHLLALFHTEAQRREVEARLDELQQVQDHWRQTYQSEKVHSRIDQRMATLSTKESEERL